MSEENDGQKAGDSRDTEFTPITSQEELDRLIGKRIERERSKYADYDDLKNKASKLDEIEQANKTELEKALEAAKAAEARATEAETAALRADVAAATGVPAKFLIGSTREEMEAAAEEFKEAAQEVRKPAPAVGGLKSGSAPEDTSGMTAKERAAAALRSSAK